MPASFTWMGLLSLAVSITSLSVTIAIFSLGRRLSFRQQRERVRELEIDAWKVLKPIRTDGINSKVIVMNVARYQRGYDGSNAMTWRGHAFTGPEMIEIVHSGVIVIDTAVASYYDGGRRTLTETNDRAPNVLQCGHIPWAWIEHIEPAGDEFDGSPIFFVRHKAPGRSPYNYSTFRESSPVPFGANDRDYYRPIPELGTRHPSTILDWWTFIKNFRTSRAMEKATSWDHD
ncbi:hypothetical protein ACWEK5_28170 [Rhodococcus koreensis]